ncbi:hypothetical protein A5658_24360 [Mycobacterium sp. 1245111.1]|uniref:hypothetical protein n=1 Tax=Mycobacterium sp. 1245111.1 TaxID=1834073 RepID=UPI0007FFF802|nr:hypothetical protein [Mycobacterium sp. 1245111.1]OBK39471.1 hypothetical protein A5658_24360 [Mycobacterium sp. 1245111.1]
MRAVATAACVVGALAALWFGWQAYWDLALTGFPDSHFTDYDKAVELPKGILLWIEFGFVPLFLLLGVPRIRARTGVAGPVLALAALGAVVVVQVVGVPWYFGTHLGLDNGIGG